MSAVGAFTVKASSHKERDFSIHPGVLNSASGSNVSRETIPGAARSIRYWGGLCTQGYGQC